MRSLPVGTRRRAMIFAAPLVAAGLLCGCGSGAASGGALSTHGGVATLKYTLTEQGCLPVQATVPAGAVTVIATNGGSSNVTELELQNSNEIIVAERENLTAGLSGSFSLDLGPGTYLIHCPGGAVPDGHLQVTGQATGYQVWGAKRFGTLNFGGSAATVVCTVVEAE